jgi:hypothetical protein
MVPHGPRIAPHLAHERLEGVVGADARPVLARKRGTQCLSDVSTAPFLQLHTLELRATQPPSDPPIKPSETLLLMYAHSTLTRVTLSPTFIQRSLESQVGKYPLGR